MTSAHDPRPRPQYGEYAEPEDQDSAAPSAEEPQTTGAGAADSDTAATALDSSVREWAKSEGLARPDTAPVNLAAPKTTPARASSGGTGPLPGVPHNLGVKGGSVPAAPAQPGHSGSARPEEPAPREPHAAYGPSATEPNASASTPGQPGIAPKPRSADRIVTIALLAVGAYFALSMALTLSQFSLEFGRVAEDLGVSDFTAPPALKVIGTVGAILVLAIYALVLIFSIRRLRARKLTFWAPLAAGALAWVVFFVLFLIGLNQSPDLMQGLLEVASDPAAAQQLLERLGTTS